MITARVDALGIVCIVQFVIESEGPRHCAVGLNDEIVEVRTDAVRTDDEKRVGVVPFDVVAIIATHHIHVELSLNLVERDYRKVGVISRAIEAGFFSGMPYKNHGTLWLGSGRKGLRDCQQGG